MRTADANYLHQNRHTLRRVVERDMCVGCGACEVVTTGAIQVPFTSSGRYVAQAGLNDVSALAVGSRVCPFSDDAEDEDAISRRLFGGLPRHDVVGAYRSVVAARLTDEGLIRGSSSGGLATWLGARLLEEGHVDSVLCVAQKPSQRPLFQFGVASSATELMLMRKSVYYAVTMTEVLDTVKHVPGRYALVGVPCFIRAARLMAAADPDVADRLTHFLGLVCGHLKTAGFAECMAWQVGVEPAQIASVDFRVKQEEGRASQYAFSATRRADGAALAETSSLLLGGNWGHGMFQLNACNYCDDIFAETADVAIGDAWLPAYSHYSLGTNIVVSRSDLMDSLLRSGAEAGELTLETLTAADAALSQAGNYRHRREGLALRLHDDIRAGFSVPRKRVAPTSRHLSRRRRGLVRLRRSMGPASIEAFEAAKQAGDFGVFVERMRPLVVRYSRVDSRRSLGSRLRSKLARQFRRLGSQ